jgi:hypothetical protein
VTELTDLIAADLADHFPPSVEKGSDYGEVDPVMIDAEFTAGPL